MQLKVSIIVPVYNAASTLRKCVDSLLAQTLKDFEVLLIDDGSTDGSGALCDEYARQDSRVKAFHKSNGGVSSARQFGIDHAQGEYTIHADPDDWVEPGMLEELYKKAKETDADMVICDYWENGLNFQKRVIQQPSSLEPHKVLHELFTHLHGSTCNKLIRKDCYTKYSVLFPEGINYCEDLYVCASLLKHDIKVAYLPKAFYHYFNDTNKDSLSRHYDENTLLRDLRIRELFDHLLLGSSVHRRAMDMLMASTICNAFYSGSHIFSSQGFKKHFYAYRHLFREDYAYPYERPFIYLGCCGYYHAVYPIFRLVVGGGVKLKKMVRKVLPHLGILRGEQKPSSGDGKKKQFKSHPNAIQLFYKYVVGSGVWKIAFLENNLDEIVDGRPLRFREARYHLKKRWFADPFVLRVTENDIEVLVEDLDLRVSKTRARISRVTFTRDTLQLKDIHILLDLDTHLSYPAWFVENGQLYVYPENSESGRLKLYRYNDKTDVLEFDRLLSNDPLTDATLFDVGPGKKMLTTRVPETETNKVWIYAKNEHGVFSEESHYDFKDRVARNGGSVFEVNGTFYRPAQICNHTYGEGLCIQKVNYNLGKISFTEVRRIMPPKGWQRIHTLNSLGNVTVVDLGRDKYPILSKCFRAIRASILILIGEKNRINN